MIKHSVVMSEVINERRYAKIAEVGVWQGWFLTGMFFGCPGITEYWAVDPWAFNNVPGDPREMIDQKQWSSVYLTVCNALKYYPQLKIIRAKSVDVAQLFPEGYFDLVFIDGDHSYEGVLKDLKAWTPLVRKGGMMSGHDYKRSQIGVVNAVYEFYSGTAERLPATCWIKEIE